MTDTVNPNFPRGVEAIVGVMIENPQGQILLSRGTKWENNWTIPGGHIEPGETIIQAALREAQEETGLDCQAIGVFSHGEIVGPPQFHRPAHFIYFNVYCQSDGKNLKIDQSELTEHQWIDPQLAKETLNISVFGNTIEDFIKYKKALK